MTRIKVRAEVVGTKPEKNGRQEIALQWADKLVTYDLPVDVARAIVRQGWGEVEVPAAEIQ